MKPYQTLYSRIVAANPWYRLRQDEVLLPNGEKTLYNVINKPDAVWIVPILRDGRVVLVNQYRYPIDAWRLEIPAGGIAQGKTPEEVAYQELAEEIGGQTHRPLTFLGKYWTMKGIGDELGYFFLAQDVSLGQVRHEATEIMELKTVTGAEALQMARTGQIADAPSALALLLCEHILSQ